MIQKTINELAELRGELKNIPDNIKPRLITDAPEKFWSLFEFEQSDSLEQDRLRQEFKAQAANQIPTLKKEMDEFIAWLEKIADDGCDDLRAEVVLAKLREDLDCTQSTANEEKRSKL